jgi:hypothetical protein
VCKTCCCPLRYLSTEGVGIIGGGGGGRERGGGREKERGTESELSGPVCTIPKVSSNHSEISTLGGRGSKMFFALAYWMLFKLQYLHWDSYVLYIISLFDFPHSQKFCDYNLLYGVYAIG